MLWVIIFSLLSIVRLANGQNSTPLRFLDTPKGLTVCSQSQYFSWEGGAPPYTSTVLREYQVIQKLDPTSVSDMQLNMTVYGDAFSPGREFKFQVSDSAGSSIVWSSVLLPCASSTVVTLTPTLTPTVQSSSVSSSSSRVIQSTDYRGSSSSLDVPTARTGASGTTASGLSKGAIAGIAVGILAAVLLNGLFAWFLLRQRRRQQAAAVKNRFRPDLVDDEELHMHPYDSDTPDENSTPDPYIQPVTVPPTVSKASAQRDRASHGQADVSEKALLSSSLGLASSSGLPTSSTSSSSGWEPMSGTTAPVAPLPDHDIDMGPLENIEPDPPAPLLPPMYNPDWRPENRNEQA